MRLIWCVWPIAMLLASQSAVADCACLCVDGSYRTVCTTLEDARAAGNVCEARTAQGCQMEGASGPARSYPPPAEGASDCRDGRVYDAVADEVVVARVCNVEH